MSKNFWSKTLGAEPKLHVPGMTEFSLGVDMILGLMPNKGIKKLLGPAIEDPEKAFGIPRAEIYLRVKDPINYLDRALKAGAKSLSPFQLRDWGNSAGYIADPDGHVVAFSD